MTEKAWVAKFPKKIKSALSKFPRIVSIRGICSGQPCVSDRRIPVWVLASRYACGEGFGSIAADYGIDKLDVREAVRFALWVSNLGDIKFWKFYRELEKPGQL